MFHISSRFAETLGIVRLVVGVPASAKHSIAQGLPRIEALRFRGTPSSHATISGHLLAFDSVISTNAVGTMLTPSKLSVPLHLSVIPDQLLSVSILAYSTIPFQWGRYYT